MPPKAKRTKSKKTKPLDEAPQYQPPTKQELTVRQKQLNKLASLERERSNIYRGFANDLHQATIREDPYLNKPKLPNSEKENIKGKVDTIKAFKIAEADIKNQVEQTPFSALELQNQVEGSLPLVQDLKSKAGVLADPTGFSGEIPLEDVKRILLDLEIPKTMVASVDRVMARVRKQMEPYVTQAYKNDIKQIMLRLNKREEEAQMFKKNQPHEYEVFVGTIDAIRGFLQWMLDYGGTQELLRSINIKLTKGLTQDVKQIVSDLIFRSGLDAQRTINVLKDILEEVSKQGKITKESLDQVRKAVLGEESGFTSIPSDEASTIPYDDDLAERLEALKTDSQLESEASIMTDLILSSNLEDPDVRKRILELLRADEALSVDEKKELEDLLKDEAIKRTKKPKRTPPMNPSEAETKLLSLLSPLSKKNQELILGLKDQNDILEIINSRVFKDFTQKQKNEIETLLVLRTGKAPKRAQSPFTADDLEKGKEKLKKGRPRASSKPEEPTLMSDLKKAVELRRKSLEGKGVSVSNKDLTIQNGYLGKLRINMTNLRKMELKAYQGRNKIAEGKLSQGMFNLLTKPKITKEFRSMLTEADLEQYRHLVDLAGIDYTRSKATKAMLIKAPKGKVGKGVQKEYVFYKDPSELKDRLQLIIGEIEAGNNSPDLKEEASQLLQLLKDNKVISEMEFISMMELF